MEPRPLLLLLLLRPLPLLPRPLLLLWPLPLLRPLPLVLVSMGAGLEAGGPPNGALLMAGQVAGVVAATQNQSAHATHAVTHSTCCSKQTVACSGSDRCHAVYQHNSSQAKQQEC